MPDAQLTPSNLSQVLSVFERLIVPSPKCPGGSHGLDQLEVPEIISQGLSRLPNVQQRVVRKLMTGPAGQQELLVQARAQPNSVAAAKAALRDLFKGFASPDVLEKSWTLLLAGLPLEKAQKLVMFAGRYNEWATRRNAQAPSPLRIPAKQGNLAPLSMLLQLVGVDERFVNRIHYQIKEIRDRSPSSPLEIEISCYERAGAWSGIKIGIVDGCNAFRTHSIVTHIYQGGFVRNNCSVCGSVIPLRTSPPGNGVRRIFAKTSGAKGELFAALLGIPFTADALQFSVCLPHDLSKRCELAMITLLPVGITNCTLALGFKVSEALFRNIKGLSDASAVFASATPQFHGTLPGRFSLFTVKLHYQDNSVPIATGVYDREEGYCHFVPPWNLAAADAKSPLILLKRLLMLRPEASSRFPLTPVAYVTIPPSRRIRSGREVQIFGNTVQVPAECSLACLAFVPSTIDTERTLILFDATRLHQSPRQRDRSPIPIIGGILFRECFQSPADTSRDLAGSVLDAREATTWCNRHAVDYLSGIQAMFGQDSIHEADAWIGGLFGR